MLHVIRNSGMYTAANELAACRILISPCFGQRKCVSPSPSGRQTADIKDVPNVIHAAISKPSAIPRSQPLTSGCSANAHPTDPSVNGNGIASSTVQNMASHVRAYLSVEIRRTRSPVRARAAMARRLMINKMVTINAITTQNMRICVPMPFAAPLSSPTCSLLNSHIRP